MSEFGDPRDLLRRLTQSQTRIESLERELEAKEWEIIHLRSGISTAYSQLGQVLFSAAPKPGNEAYMEWEAQRESREAIQDDETAETAEAFNDARFGEACQAVFAKFKLRRALCKDVVRYYDETNHTAWYWRLVTDSELDSIRARELTQAMHADTGYRFDYDSCIVTPSH
ncbi:hypothetical protein BC629DRAFT_1438289 [Irpex lacteus]|nr:hypothetical protein BC629DRAFT_1438289 [Irpex lacteus]